MDSEGWPGPAPLGLTPSHHRRLDCLDGHVEGGRRITDIARHVGRHRGDGIITVGERHPGVIVGPGAGRAGGRGAAPDGH